MLLLPIHSQMPRWRLNACLKRDSTSCPLLRVKWFALTSSIEAVLNVWCQDVVLSMLHDWQVLEMMDAAFSSAKPPSMAASKEKAAQAAQAKAAKKKLEDATISARVSTPHTHVYCL